MQLEVAVPTAGRVNPIRSPLRQHTLHSAREQLRCPAGLMAERSPGLLELLLGRFLRLAEQQLARVGGSRGPLRSPTTAAATQLFECTASSGHGGTVRSWQRATKQRRRRTS